MKRLSVREKKSRQINNDMKYYNSISPISTKKIVTKWKKKCLFHNNVVRTHILAATFTMFTCATSLNYTL